MQHFILNNKILELVKNKEVSLAIPVMFNAGNAEFTLELLDNQYLSGIIIEFSILRTALGSGVKTFSVQMQAPVTRFRPTDVGDIESSDYLLHAFKANYSARLALTIEALR